MATTATAATDSKTIIKGTTEQNKTNSRNERMKIHQVLFCSVVPFIIVVDNLEVDCIFMNNFEVIHIAAISSAHL